MKIGIISLISVLILFAGVSASILGDAADGAEPTTITDGTGVPFTYAGPTEHIVTTGYGSTLTVAMLGEIEKIIAVDTYSTYEYTKDERLKDLNATSVGSLYSSSNNDYIVSLFVQWVDEGKMNLDDTIILTTYNNSLVLRDLLNSIGFSKVLVYLEITSYDQVVDFVRSMSVIVTGKVSGIVNDMELVKATIDDGLMGIGEKAKGLSTWYISSSGFTVNNKGSIATSLIETAGGINVAYDPSISTVRYGDASTIVQMVEAHPGLVIFMSNFSGSISDFRNTVLGGRADVPVIPMEANWNNYCPDAAEGLWAVACALYPNLFEGPAPHDDGPSDPNTLLWAFVGIVSVIIIFGIAYFFLRKPKRVKRRQPSPRRLYFKERFKPSDSGKKRKRLILTAAALAAIMIISILLELSWAPDALSLRDVWDVLMGNGTWANDIIVGRNAPRVVFGLFVGAALGVTGGVMQAVFRNPLASPYLLGLSSGASLGAAIAILFSIPLIPLAIMQPALAFIFCLGTMFLVYTLSRAGGSVRTETLILAGVAISSLISAAVSLLTYIAPSDKMGDIVFWTMGSLSKVTWSEMAFAIPVIVVGTIIMLAHSKSLNAMMLGDYHAMDLGVDVREVRLLLLIISSLVVAAAVAFVGAIGFVGLVIPHIFRLLLGPDNRLILPLSAFGGAAFLILCDYVAHIVAPMYGVMPIGVVTAFVGAPFFIYLLSKKRSEVGW